MPTMKRATKKLVKLGGEGFYVSKNLWGYSILPNGSFFCRGIEAYVYETPDAAIEAFLAGERPVVTEGVKDGLG